MSPTALGHLIYILMEFPNAAVHDKSPCAVSTRRVDSGGGAPLRSNAYLLLMEIHRETHG